MSPWPPESYAVAYSLPYATFAVICDQGGVCVEAAPIASWAVGKTEAHITDYFRRKGAHVKALA